MNIWEAADKHRKALIRRDTATLRRLRVLYDGAQKRIEEKLKALELQMLAKEAAGETITDGWLRMQQRYYDLYDQVQVEMRKLSAEGAQLTKAAQADVVPMGNAHAIAQIELQSSIAFNRLPVEALEAFAGLSSSGSPLAALFNEFGAKSAKGIEDALFQGIATGQGARKTAQDLRDFLGGNRARALTIARTETTRAYRLAAQRTMEASGIVIGKRRVCSRSLRTCIACIDLDGEIYPLSAELDNHVNCRCSWAAVVDERYRTLRLPERESAREWFARQSPKAQDSVLGIAGGAAYRGRELPLRAWVGETRSARWGLTRAQRSLKQAREAARVEVPIL